MICDINGDVITFQTYTTSYIKDEIYRYESHNEFRTLNIYSLFEVVKNNYLRGFKDTFSIYSTKTTKRLIKINQIFN